jgi:uncharacterized lipoprotein YddW (UPF0748 family)
MERGAGGEWTEGAGRCPALASETAEIYILITYFQQKTIQTAIKPFNRPLLAAALIFLSLIFYAQSRAGGPYPYPKREVRAVWLTTVGGLDWPRSYDVAEQKRSLHEIVDKLGAANFNTIFFQVRGRGDAMYRSSYEPWSAQLTGTLGKDPGWDPLQEVIRLAHERGMEVHAWFNTFIVKNREGRSSESYPRHIVSAHPEWVHETQDEWWVDPGIPAVRAYTLNVALEIVKNYDIDGFHFDFMRYPEKIFNDGSTYRLYGNNMPKAEWRRQNIDRFVAAFYDSATQYKPRLRIGSAPIGIYRNVNGFNGLQSYDNVYQDSREWLRQGKQDYIVPQIYWAIGRTNSHPDFVRVARDWSENTLGRDVYTGLGVYKSEVAIQVPALIDTTRALGFHGSSFFRYEFIAQQLNVGGRYRFRSLQPVMPWKDSIPPNAPQHLHIKTLVDDEIRLEWSAPPPAKDGDTAMYFNIYRSAVQPVDIEDVRNLIGTLKGNSLSYVDAIEHPSSAKYYYAVTAMDGGYNESAPTHEESIIVPEIALLAKSFQPMFILGRAYPLLVSDYVYFSYELSQPAPIWLVIQDRSGKELKRVVDAYQQPGRYIAGAEVDKLSPGDYTYKLIAGKESLVNVFTVAR